MAMILFLLCCVIDYCRSAAAHHLLDMIGGAKLANFVVSG